VREEKEIPTVLGGGRERTSGEREKGLSLEGGKKNLQKKGNISEEGGETLIY